MTSEKSVGTTHAIDDEGLPLCGFTRYPKSHWADGHFWCDADDLKAITCPECKHEVERIAKDKIETPSGLSA